MQSAKETAGLQLNHEAIKLEENSGKLEQMIMENHSLNGLVIDLRNQLKDKESEAQALDKELYSITLDL